MQTETDWSVSTKITHHTKWKALTPTVLPTTTLWTLKQWLEYDEFDKSVIWKICLRGVWQAVIYLPDRKSAKLLWNSTISMQHIQPGKEQTHYGWRLSRVSGYCKHYNTEDQHGGVMFILMLVRTKGLIVYYPCDIARLWTSDDSLEIGKLMCRRFLHCTRQGQ